MAELKVPKIGVYGPKTRALQKSLSYEKVSLTWKTCNIFKYLGSRAEVAPDIDDIQDIVFMETPDRAYDPEPVEVNVWYEPFPEQLMDFSKFGIITPMGTEQTFKFHVNSFEGDGLGRHIIVGDVLEVPFLLQNGNKSFWEVTNVDRKQEFENYYTVVTTVPLSDSQETTEIEDKPSNSGVLDGISTDLNTEQDSQVPVDGLDNGDYDVDEPSSEEDYDPRPDDAEDFLDNPDKAVF